MAWNYDDQANWHQNQAGNARSWAEHDAHMRAAEGARFDADAQRRREQAERQREEAERQRAWQQRQQDMWDSYQSQSSSASSGSSYGSYGDMPSYDAENPLGYILAAGLSSGGLGGCGMAILKVVAVLWALLFFVSLSSGHPEQVGTLDWVIVPALIYFAFIRDR